MKKLELKHIVGYLPYNLKVKSGNVNLIRTLNIEIDENFRDIITLNNLITGIGHKPILRPLSDLTKEIEVNGEKFVPIEWFEIGEDSNDSEEYDHGNIKLIKTLERISKFNISNDILFLPHGVVQKLYEWHFDVHGLIEKGLAIDINTLSKEK